MDSKQNLSGNQYYYFGHFITKKVLSISAIHDNYYMSGQRFRAGAYEAATNRVSYYKPGSPFVLDWVTL